MKKLALIMLVVMLGFAFFSCSKKVQEQMGPSAGQPFSQNSSVSPYTKPKDIIDFGPWSLSLPFDTATGLTSGLTTINSSTLVGGYEYNPYFYVPDSPYNTRVRFWCPIDGATSTPGSGSDHPRTELKEDLPWQSKYYPTNTYPTIGGRLEGEFLVKQVPTSSSHIIFAQIHGGGAKPYSTYPFVLFSFRNDSVFATVKNDTVGSSGKKIYLLKGVSLNTKVKFSVVDSVGSDGISKVYVTASAPGSTVITNSTYTSPLVVPANWLAVPVRFQSGDYVQAETDDTSIHVPNSTDGGKIDFFSLRIVHH